MAEHALIEKYLDELRHMLRRSAEADDIVAEVADHLFEGVFRRREQGLALLVAERSVLTEFGDPILVSRAFASSKHGGIAVPTTFTKKAGLLGIISAVLYVGATIAMIVDNAVNRTGDWDGVYYNISIYSFIGAGLLLTAMVVGLNRRHGGAIGWRGRAAPYVLGAAAITSLGVWFWGIWMSLLVVGTVLLVTALREHGLAPLWAGAAMLAGPLLAYAAMWTPQAMPNLNGQSFGDDPTIWFASVGLLLFAAGVYGIGHWLYLETPVDEPSNLLNV